MNIQAMMKQAQKLQKEMMSAKEEIDKKEFEGTSEMVAVTFDGSKKLLRVKLNVKELEADDVEILEDMFVVAVNNAMTKIDQETEQKMGQYTQGMPGLF